MPVYSHNLLIDGKPREFSPGETIEIAADVQYAYAGSESYWIAELNQHDQPFRDAGMRHFGNTTVHGFDLPLRRWEKETAPNSNVYVPMTLGPGEHTLMLNGAGNVERKYVRFKLVQKPVATRWNGTITDNGSVTDNIRDMKKFGFDSLRIWLGWSGSGHVSNDTINLCNEYVRRGVNVIVCFTPPEDAASVKYPSAGIAQIIANLDKRVVVGIINEPNLVKTDPDGKKHWYWPDGDWRKAFRDASRISAELQAAGFKTASPCFTFQWAPSVRDWWNEAIANGWTNFDYIDGHNYPTVQGWATGVAEAVQNFRDVLTVYRNVANQLGKKCMCSEWGMYGSQAKFAEAYPQLDAIVRELTDASAYFIMRPGRHGEFGLHLIGADGKPTALGTAAMAVKQGGVS